MTTNMRVEDRLDGVDKSRYWKNRVILILEHSDLLDNIKKTLPDPGEEEAPCTHNRY
jgi:hypothetical protein